MRPLTAFLAALIPATVTAQASRDSLRPFISVDSPVVAITNVTVIDGTGAPAQVDNTVVIRNGRIAEVGTRVAAPSGAQVIDGHGKTLIPGLVGMHDHLSYTAAGGRDVSAAFTGPRLYLASGVTTIRTTGATSAYTDINTKREIDAGRSVGPHIVVTAPYVTGAGPTGTAAMAVLTTPEAARRFVDYWAAEGATWIKAYTDISRENLRATILEAHKRGLKVTGHLCSVTYQEAVRLGGRGTGSGSRSHGERGGSSRLRRPARLRAAAGGRVQRRAGGADHVLEWCAHSRYAGPHRLDRAGQERRRRAARRRSRRRCFGDPQRRHRLQGWRRVRSGARGRGGARTGGHQLAVSISPHPVRRHENPQRRRGNAWVSRGSRSYRA